MLRTSTITPIGITALPSLRGSQIRIEPGSLVYDNKWINYKGAVFDLNEYISEMVLDRGTFFNNRRFAFYLVIGINFFGRLTVEEGVQVPFRLREAVPPPRIQGIIPLLGVVLVQNGSQDLNFGYEDIGETHLIKYTGYGNILEKNLPGITGSFDLARGERGPTGAQGETGEQGVTGGLGIAGIQGPAGPLFVGSTGAQGLTGLNYNTQYDTGLEFYLKLNDTGETGMDSSGLGRHVAWQGEGLSYHNSVPAALCEGQSTVDMGATASFNREDTGGFSIAMGPGVVSEVVYLDLLPMSGNRAILLEVEDSEYKMIYYIDSDGRLNFESNTHRWFSNARAVNAKEWTLVEFHRFVGNVGRIYRTTAATARTEMAHTRITL